MIGQAFYSPAAHHRWLIILFLLLEHVMYSLLSEFKKYNKNTSEIKYLPCF